MSNGTRLLIEVDLDFLQTLNEWRDECKKRKFFQRDRIQPMIRADLNTMKRLK